MIGEQRIRKNLLLPLMKSLEMNPALLQNTNQLMTTKVNFPLSLEEQIALIPKLAVSHQRFRNFTTFEDGEEAAADVIYYAWKKGEEMNKKLLYWLTKKRLWNMIRIRGDGPVAENHRAVQKRDYFSMPISDFADQETELGETIPDSANVEEQALLNVAFGELLGTKWGAKIVQRTLAQGGRTLTYQGGGKHFTPSPLPLIKRHKQELEEIFEGFL